jgi:hypothetical protein
MREPDKEGQNQNQEKDTVHLRPSKEKTRRLEPAGLM